MPDTKIDAVAEAELRNFLASIGELESVESGSRNCAFCGTKIGLNNLHAIIPGKDEVEYCCDADLCIAEMSWGEP